MKKWIINLLVLALVMGALSSCEEVGPVINLTGDTKVDTTYITTPELPQQKNILLEEFTGVKCINCPAAHEVIEILEGQYGTRLIPVSIHSMSLSSPYGSDQNLNVQEADDLWSYIGPGDGKPLGSVDRKSFSGESGLLVGTDKWGAYVDQQIQKATPVNISIETDFNDESRDLDVGVIIHYTSNVSDDNYLSVMILEDNIITSQLGVGGVDPHYVQNQVLRTMLTSSTGILLNVIKEPGRVVVKRFKKEALPALWDADNLRIVAIVHRSDSSKEVLQAVQQKVKL